MVNHCSDVKNILRKGDIIFNKEQHPKLLTVLHIIMIVFVGLAVLTLLISIIAHFIVGGRPFYHFAYVLFIIGMLAEVSINIIQRQTQDVVLSIIMIVLAIIIIFAD